MKKNLTVADVMADTLISLGVKVIFGYPGAAICPFYNALLNANKRSEAINHILVRHEQNAGHSASGYARISGKPSVCVATSGPGALNLITAIATSYMDSVPLVIITGQVESGLLGRDVFQEADITGAAEPFVKHSYLVRKGQSAAHILREAFLIAGTGRKGPVLVDIPMDIQLEKAEADKEALQDEIQPPRGYNIELKLDEKALNGVSAAGALLEKAKHPLLCVGGGVILAEAKAELRAFLDKTGIYFVCTMMGIGAASPDDVHFLGMLGQHGHHSANRAVEAADLLFFVGARIGDRAVSSQGEQMAKKKIIHLDIDPAELNKNMKTDLAIAGDLKRLLPLLTKEVKPLKLDNANPFLQEKALLLKYKAESAGYPAMLLREIYKSLSPDAIVAADVGQHLLWAAREYSLPQGQLLASGGMGTMGYAIPAAVGAQLAAPNRQTVAFCGDGGFQMSMAELATIKRERLPIKLILFDNHCLGLVKELQDVQYNGGELAVCMDGNPDFMKIALAYDIKAYRIKQGEDYADILRQFAEDRGTCLLLCEIDNNAKTI